MREYLGSCSLRYSNTITGLSLEYSTAYVCDVYVSVVWEGVVCVCVCVWGGGGGGAWGVHNN